jgi:hypothetical protein
MLCHDLQFSGVRRRQQSLALPSPQPNNPQQQRLVLFLRELSYRMISSLSDRFLSPFVGLATKNPSWFRRLVSFLLQQRLKHSASHRPRYFLVEKTCLVCPM